MKHIVIDMLSGKELVAGAEEQEATQPLLFHLTQQLGWNPQQFKTRPQWRVPKTPSGARSSGYPVDIAIFDAPENVGRPEHVRILVECKAPDETSGTDQLKTYLSLEPEARLGIWFNGDSHVLVYKLANGFSVNKYAPIPRPSDPLSPSATHPPLTFGDLVAPPNLREIFKRLRDRIAAQDSQVNRDEFILNDLANLLICKIADEQMGEVDPERPMAFQLAGSEDATGHAVRKFFDDVRSRLTSVFTDDRDRLHIDDTSLSAVVEVLQAYRLLGHDRHAVGQAFQVLRGRALKGEEGAYFTPPPVVDCAISLLDPDERSRTIDPACGTGGFLAATLDHVFERIDAKSKVSTTAKTDGKRRWAAENLFAIDKDAVSTKLCKAYLTLLGDGRSHVYRADAIDRSEWNDRSDDLRRSVAAGGFDVVVTNPPFGKNLKVSPDVAASERLKIAHRWRRVGNTWNSTDVPIEQQLGLAFFERGIELLRDGGRMAIVLPETFLFSSTFRWFVDWIASTFTITHIVDVPMVAFEEFCRAKTCLLFLRKQAPAAGHAISMSFPRTIGQDRDGKPLRKLGPSGERQGDLDNEMADAVRELTTAPYGAIPKAQASRYHFPVPQKAAAARGVLVPRFWWRSDAQDAVDKWMTVHASETVTLGSLADAGVIQTFDGHGSPPSNARATGDVPYVKVTDLKNWRINENPTNFIHADLAAKLKRGGPALSTGDLITPARASANIGQFSFVLPWQTNVVLTKEVLIIRVAENDRGIDAYLLLALMSLKVVQKQYENLVLMQTNREHLGDHWREVLIPLPATTLSRDAIRQPVKSYFEALIHARESYVALSRVIPLDEFGTRP